jgi:hydroxymethylpyrimidine pyrophosphatase-like HAD family hydrolase
MQNEIHFMLHKQIPHNHEFYFWGNPETNTDFKKRLELYCEHAHPYSDSLLFEHEITQFVAIFSPDELEKFDFISRQLSHLKTIRTTSPLDFQSIWLEIFPAHVSKGHTAKWLCDFLRIERAHSFAIGNDYNDLDLLDWANFSYVVKNAPFSLQKTYQVTDSNENNGFSKAIRKEIGF